MTRRGTALLLILALLAPACDDLLSFVDSEIKQAQADVKNEHGIDITDPTQVMIASSIGSKEESEQLETARSVQRFHNENKGDAAMQKNDTVGAREAYQRALAWTGSKDKRNRDAINEKLADTWLEQSIRFGDDSTMRGLRSAESSYGRLVAGTTDPAAKGRILTKQALAAQRLDRNGTKHCELAVQALKIDRNNDVAFHRVFKDPRCSEFRF